MWGKEKGGRDSFERIYDRASEKRKTGRRILKIRDKGEDVKNLRRGESIITRIVPYITRCYSCKIFDIDDISGDIKWEIMKLEIGVKDLDEKDLFHVRCQRHEEYDRGY